jgi:chromosome segregation protein
MYLKRLELHGFKSFADRTALDLHPGLNAVVGPNGSGKSNISDAVLWVLGEQNARLLRGVRMEDVIFSGSDHRRPLGLAEVNLILDNTDGTLPMDYQEVSIKRRLFRSGESEYYINKTQCRLKDIHELLLDTGLGKDAYSQIGQGRIDEVLSVKAEDRRVLIEDAAGIIKYKTRKREALRKLDETSQNLLRVMDIMAELDSQKAPLSAEAEKARVFIDLKSQRDHLEISLAIWAMDQLREEREKEQGLFLQLQDSLVELDARISTGEASMETKQLELLNLEQQIAQQQQSLYQLEGRLERGEVKITHYQDQIRELESHQQRLALESQEIQKEIDDADASLQKERARWEEIRQSLEQLELTVQERDQHYQSVLAQLTLQETDIERKKDSLLDWMNQSAEKNHRIRLLEAAGQRLLNDIRRRHNEHEEIQHDFTIIEERLLGVESSVSAIMADRESASISEKSLHQTRQTHITELSRFDQETNSLQERLRQDQSRLRVLDDMSKDYEGYQKGVRTVLLGAREKQFPGEGICGVVSELMQTEARYERAISAALGSTLQNIVTQTTHDAMSAIAFLKKHNGGRSTFLPLDVIRANPRPTYISALSKEKGIIGYAADLVAMDPIYDAIKESLLGHILVADTLENAVEVAKKSGHRVRIATLDGDILSPGGAMTGGSQTTAQSGLLGRSREIALLRKNITQQVETISKRMQTRGHMSGQIESIEEEMRKVSDRLVQIDLEMASLLKEKEQILIQRHRLQRQADTVQFEHESLLQEAAEGQKEITLLREGEAIASETRRELEIEIDRLMEELKVNLALKEDVQTRITENKVSLASIRQQEISMADQVRIQERMKMGFVEQLKKLVNDKTSDHARTEEIKRICAECEEEQNGIAAQRAQAEVAVTETRNLRQQIFDLVNEEERRLKRLRRKLTDAQNECHGKELHIARLDMEYKSVIEKIQEQFGMTYQQGKEVASSILDREDTVERIAGLKSAMDELGVVNTGAVDEYKRIMERFEFLQKQSTDLQEAERGLYQVIFEMDKVMRKQFLETYQRVRTHFDLVFKQMFEGGKADLVLTDSEHPLESGLEIVAQPPGKKLQNLSLLSGGERALTAISLLFAILKTRPASFCVLDEIDSSLDESNVERFARFLKDLTQETQFIVVTHRKGTMESADTMYGVTMEESGVSKLVSVRFVEPVHISAGT